MKTILLLHGAIGAKDQMIPIEKVLSTDFSVFSLNFSGHGGNEINGNFSIEKFADEVVDFLTKKHLTKVSIFGYSMGGYVALYLANHYPEKIESVITLATKFQWDNDIAAKEIKMLQPEIIEEKLPTFAQQLAERHHPIDWKMVLEKTADMLVEMGRQNPLQPTDFKSIQCPVLLMLGDRDKMVSLAETVEVYNLLASSQLAVLPKTSHPIEQVDVHDIFYYAKKFIRTNL